MNAVLPLVDLAGLDEEARQSLVAEVGGHHGLERVVRWALSSRPARMVVDVVKQDELTQDVVVAYAPGRYLVYDTT